MAADDKVNTLLVDDQPGKLLSYEAILTELGETLTLAGVLSELNRSLPVRRTVVWDGGRFLGEALKYICGPDYRSEVLSTAFGVVGPQPAALLL